ncbi:MAG TPA: response regulator, partial [Chromatiales bacterium]|nr:response regulator [Chromatiales bacterium]
MEERPMQVLIVDDIPVNRKVLCQMLSTYDYEVIEAEDGHQAI